MSLEPVHLTCESMEYSSPFYENSLDSSIALPCVANNKNAFTQSRSVICLSNGTMCMLMSVVHALTGFDSRRSPLRRPFWYAGLLCCQGSTVSIRQLIVNLSVSASWLRCICRHWSRAFSRLPVDSYVWIDVLYQWVGQCECVGFQWIVDLPNSEVHQILTQLDPPAWKRFAVIKMIMRGSIKSGGSLGRVKWYNTSLKDTWSCPNDLIKDRYREWRRICRERQRRGTRMNSGWNVIITRQFDTG